MECLEDRGIEQRDRDEMQAKDTGTSKKSARYKRTACDRQTYGVDARQDGVLARTDAETRINSFFVGLWPRVDERQR